MNITIRLKSVAVFVLAHTKGWAKRQKAVRKERKEGMRNSQLGWKLIVRGPTGDIMKVHRRLPREEAERKMRRALKRGCRVEVTEEHRGRSRRSESYVNRHPKARRAA